MTRSLGDAEKHDYLQMMDLAAGYWVTQVVAATARYYIADHIGSGSVTYILIPDMRR